MTASKHPCASEGLNGGGLMLESRPTGCRGARSRASPGEDERGEVKTEASEPASPRGAHGAG